MEDVEYVKCQLDRGGFSVNLPSRSPIKLSMWSRYRAVDPSEVSILADLETSDGYCTCSVESSLKELCDIIKPHELVYFMSVREMPKDIVGMRMSGAVAVNMFASIGGLEYLEYTPNDGVMFSGSDLVSLRRLDIHIDENPVYGGDFALTPNLEEVHVYGIGSIDDYAFSTCPMLRSVTFHNEVQSIGVRCFEECRRLRYCNLDALTDALTLGKGAFRDTPLESRYHSKYIEFIKSRG